MAKIWKVVGIATLVAILGVAAVGAVAFAQDDDGTGFDFHQRFREAVAEILGITVDEYDAALEQAQDQVVDDALTEGWLTEDQAEMLRWRMDQAPGFPRGDMGKMAGGFVRGMHGPGDSLLSIAAEALDMSLTELLTELQDGQSVADVAGEKGVDTQVIVDAYLAEIQQDVDEAVAEGDMTQKQADYYLEQAEARVTEQLDRVWEDGFGGVGGRRGGHPGSPGIAFPGMGGF
jgi:polyhydroxyalkanoate synthesis regulator phasin